MKEDCKYIFSIQGSATLKTPNLDVMNFILSFRVCLNSEAREDNLQDNDIRTEFNSLEEILSIDFIKIKIFS